MPSSYLTTALAAGLCAILSGLGIGSAGLFVLYLTFIAGYAQPEAQATNLLFFLLSAGAALLLHIRDRKIPWRTVGFLILCALPGAFLGAYLVRILNASLIRRLFGGMLVATGIPVLLRKNPKAPKNSPESSEKT
jgi:uncharacterized membrane protein YfcA